MGANLEIKRPGLLDYYVIEHLASCLHEGTMTSYVSYSSYFTRLLSLSMDVESNPGPIDSNDKQEILDAIKASGDGIRVDIQDIRRDIDTIRSDMKSVWDVCKNMNSRVDKIDT